MVEIRRVQAPAGEGLVDELAEVLFDCVQGGASVSYMAPFSRADARRAFQDFLHDVALGRRLLLAAFVDGRLVGTVQMVHASAPNQGHRGDVAKLLVHRAGRRQGVAQALMARLEQEARIEGKRLLVLDTVTGGDAERLYERLGWTRVGVIPDYALFPDGRPCSTTVFWKALSPGS